MEVQTSRHLLNQDYLRFEECKTGVIVSTELNRSRSNSFHGYGARLTCVQFSVLVWNVLAKYFADDYYLKTHMTEFKFA